MARKYLTYITCFKKPLRYPTPNFTQLNTINTARKAFILSIYKHHFSVSFTIFAGVSNDISRKDEIPFSPRFSTTFSTIFENILCILYKNLLYEHLS